MQAVGEHLADFARNATDTEIWDIFGRSAFNRFYYGVFLTVRSFLGKLNSAWSTPNHADIPNLLRGAVIKKIKQAIEEQTKKNLLSYSEGMNLRNQAQVAVNDLASLLETARELRRVADYEPEKLMTRQGQVLFLVNEKLDSAKKWQNRAKVNTHSIEKIYEHLGLI